MIHSQQKEAEELTRQEAAGRPTDIATALTAGGSAKQSDGRETIVPIADRVLPVDRERPAADARGDRTRRVSARRSPM